MARTGIPAPPLQNGPDAYWAEPADAILARLGSSAKGLSSEQARKVLAQVGINSVAKAQKTNGLLLFVRQLLNPLVLVLIFAALVSGLVGEVREALIIVAIVFGSCFLGFFQEFRASRAIEELQSRFSMKANVLRDGKETTIQADQVVPGDIISLSAGNLISADGVLIDSKDLNVGEAVLTGEPFPVVKAPGTSPADAGIAARTNAVFAGTSVRSGTARMLVVRTGTKTEIAGIAAAIVRQEPETAFGAGIRHFGTLMTEFMFAIVLAVLAVNYLLGKPIVDSLMFSLALAVGLTPELLPAIISVTLSNGARAMAKGGVIVRRLEAIENLGSMNMLCTDKTGTLTEGVINLDGWPGMGGTNEPGVLLLARLNAGFQSGIRNPLDDAIGAYSAEPIDLSAYDKIDEIPYDFIRKRLSVIVRSKATADRDLLICKGAVDNVLAVCSTVLVAGKAEPLDDAHRAAIDARFRDWSGQGFRVLAVASRDLNAGKGYSRDIETGMTLAGFLLFLDPPKAGMVEALKAMAKKGIAIKMITGDNRYVAAHLAGQVGLGHKTIITGSELAQLTDEALTARAGKTDLFVEIDPNQKERIIRSLRKSGHVVGYMGDGINDAPALHEADVGISVDSAVDVARDAADMLLLKQDLGILLVGIEQGRRTFANSMKYITMTTSANFGNMISMAVASTMLPFLPLLAKQILLNNFLSDLPSLAIASDNVDADQITRPHRWNIGYIARFMVSFGLMSTIFDFMTFGFLLYVMKAGAATFQTAWFMESLLTELGMVMVLRSRQALWKSAPSPILGWLSVVVGALAIAIPYLPFAAEFGFVPLSWPMMAGLLAITVLYLAGSTALKVVFNRMEDRRIHPRRVISRHR